MSLAKLIKAWQIVHMPRLASTMIRHRVAGAIEHLDALRFLAPASVLDVGANKGQFSAVVRALFPDAIIHSFEPLPGARARFEAVFAGDTRTILHPFAIGTETKTATFYIADRDDSSSLFELGTGQT
ncbi:MAG: FkbM family methyltransferase, partial [Novosphingobium sp.]